jgi:hypothetical protein
VSRIALAFVKSLITSSVAISLVIVLVTVYDTVNDHRVLIGLGSVLIFMGIITVLSCIFMLNRIPERLVMSGHSFKGLGGLAPFYNTLFLPMWASFKTKPSARTESITLRLMMVGLTFFVVGIVLA